MILKHIVNTGQKEREYLLSRGVVLHLYKKLCKELLLHLSAFQLVFALSIFQFLLKSN
ncbi:hypothetical protein SAMN05444340_1253 [Citreimonas salinaria]|uniref:Uncharacterized protein n=1 Tax=Citreimonas salinaria TaxID=321339 RepID=A0A1H3NKP5_9RHOB|nr:hypothetical protein SAMN05444340_1253 [Citreimonas salinaria]